MDKIEAATLVTLKAMELNLIGVEGTKAMEPEDVKACAEAVGIFYSEVFKRISESYKDDR